MWAFIFAAGVYVLTKTLWLAIPAGLLAGFIAVQVHPRTKCWKCNGDPKVRDESGRNWRNCWVCGGSGRRWRFLAVKRFME